MNAEPRASWASSCANRGGNPDLNRVSAFSTILLILMAAAAAHGTFAASANAQTPQIYAQPLQFAQPLRVMGARLDGNGVMSPTTDWITLDATPAAGSSLKCWDAFGNDGNGSPNGGDECGLPGPGYRWFFGESYVDSYYATNWQKGVDGHTGDAERAEFGWYINHTDTFLYALFTGKESRADCGGYTVDYSGVVYDFGTLTAGGWYADVNLDGTGLFHTLDPDGDGSVVVILAQSYDGANFVLSPYSQSYLWGSDATSDGVPLVGTQNGIMYDENGRCSDFHFGLCPDPLGPMVGFGNCGETQCPSAACNGRESLSVSSRLKGGVCMTKAVVKHGVANSEYGAVSPTDRCYTGTTNDKGKVAFKEKNSASGSWLISSCGVSQNVACP